VDLRFHNNEGGLRDDNLPFNPEEIQQDLEIMDHNNSDLQQEDFNDRYNINDNIDINDINNNNNQHTELSNDNQSDNDADNHHLPHERFEDFMTQMRKFDQIENELSNIIEKADEDDSESGESQLHNYRDKEKDEELGEMRFDSNNNMYSNNNNSSSSSSHSHIEHDNENDNDDNEEYEEERLHRNRRSHLVEAVSHPLADSSANVPPPSLTSLVAGNAAAPSYVNAVVTEANVNALMDMGFQKNMAEFALKTCDDDFDSALDRLLNHPEDLQLEILKSMFFS